MNDYRGDDVTRGYCPKCGRELTGLTLAHRGFCEEHGWTYADWEPRRDKVADDD